MKEYLTERISTLKNEYNELLSKIGNNKELLVEQSEKFDNKEEWKQVEDKKSRIEECKLILEFFIENNYTNA